MVPNPQREKVTSEKALLFQKNKTSNKNNKYVQTFVSITKESRSRRKRRRERKEEKEEEEEAVEEEEK